MLGKLDVDRGDHQATAASLILEWIEAKYPTPAMLPEDIDARLFARQVEVVVDGVCDALVAWAGEKEFVVGDRFGLADVATGTVCRYLDVRFPDYPWRRTHPSLSDYSDRMEQRPSFAGSVPVAQVISDKVV